MISRQHVVPVSSRSEVYTLWVIGDFHCGAKAHDREALARDVRAVAEDPCALWVCPGDVLEGIVPGDKRFRQHEVDPRYLENLEGMWNDITDELCELLSPIADKCLGVVRGNHDETVAKRHYFTIGEALKYRIGLPFLGSKGFVRLRFTRGRAVRVFTVHVCHGTGSGTSPSAALNMLSKQMLRYDADITVMGHVHAKTVWTPERVTLSRRGELRVVSEKRVGVVCGSYLRGIADGTDTYADYHGYQPQDQGAVRLLIRPFADEPDRTQPVYEAVV